MYVCMHAHIYSNSLPVCVFSVLIEGYNLGAGNGGKPCIHKRYVHEDLEKANHETLIQFRRVVPVYVYVCVGMCVCVHVGESVCVCFFFFVCNSFVSCQF